VNDEHPNNPHWRFEDLEIWQLAADLAVAFHAIAAKLDEQSCIAMRNSYGRRGCLSPTT